MRLLAIGRDPHALSPRLITPMYHGVSAQSRGSLRRQLQYMRSLGDFVGPSQAVDLVTGRLPFDGRYFCLTFDDGCLDTYRNAFPLLQELGIPGVFFVVPDWLSAAHAGEGERHYMDWQECQIMHQSGAVIGSHSMSHRRLSSLDNDVARDELQRSKEIIEQHLAAPCEHFACPWGQPIEDYLPARDLVVAEEIGYRSFFTTRRGAAISSTSPWEIPRIRLEPEWDISQLRVLFTRRESLV
jgi:peptidoglycan/xylan/chitin deacetylase (PgdA/CDA1 family)